MRTILPVFFVASIVPCTSAQEAVSFRREVIAAINVGGCNSGACHGSPNGRGGFKLSLRGHDPDADFLTLTHELQGRRVNLADPDTSMILLKPLGRIAHEGGRRFAPDSAPARAIHGWIAQGLANDAKAPAVTRLEVAPDAVVLRGPARLQQLIVTAHFADGSKRDVTPLTVYSSNEPIATISATGLVEFNESGEAAILCRYLGTMQTVRLTYLESRPDFVWTAPAENNYIDRHVFAKLKGLQIAPSEQCSDTAFVRRAHLDLCGILPTMTETREFLADASPDKRAKLIDRLLERPDHADFWTLKWLDILRNSRKNLGAQGAAAYQAWVREHVARNTPLDVMVRELLVARGDAFTNAPANYFRVDRTAEELGETTVQLFGGVRIQCAQCHNHPWENWTQEDYFGMAAFFARVQRTGLDGKSPKKGASEVIKVETTGEIKHPRLQTTVAPKFLGGVTPVIAPEQDRRETLADWLVSGENPYFARAHVNRIWFHLLGRGIVDPPDDFRMSNPASNDALLDALARDFVASKYNVKHMLRTIMNSQTYQLSARTNASNRKDVKYFSHTTPRLLTAEQLLDSLGQVTDSPVTWDPLESTCRHASLSIL